MLLLWMAVMAMFSCAGAGHSEYAESHTRESFYRSLRFDSRGMPEFSEKLSKRPDGRSGDFYLVEEDSAERPLKYYHLALKGGKADIRKPFRTVLDRTVSGIRGGAAFAIEILSSSASSSGDEAEAMVAFAAVSVAVGTAGGITVGLVEGSYDAVIEVGRVISSSEELLSFSHCDYDSMGRLSRLRAFEPGGPENSARELFRIRYSYENGMMDPYRITVEDLPS